MSLDNDICELYKQIALLRSEILESEENETPAIKLSRQLNETARNLKNDLENLNHVYRNLNESLEELPHRALLDNLVVGSAATEFVEVKENIDEVTLIDHQETPKETKFPDLHKNLGKMEMLHYKDDQNLQNLLNIHLKPDISAEEDSVPCEEGKHSVDMDTTSISSIGNSTLFSNAITSSPLP